MRWWGWDCHNCNSNCYDGAANTYDTANYCTNTYDSGDDNYYSVKYRQGPDHRGLGMTTPRRRIVRPPAASPAPDPDRTRRLQRLRARLENERAALARWTVRMRRTFHAVEKLQRSVARIERTVARLEEA